MRYLFIPKNEPVTFPVGSLFAIKTFYIQNGVSIPMFLLLLLKVI